MQLNCNFIKTQLAEAMPEERMRLIAKLAADTALSVLGEGNSSLDVRRPLMEQGFDSLRAVELRNSLSDMLGFTLPVTLLFNYPTLNDIARFLEHELDVQNTAARPIEENPSGSNGNDHTASILQTSGANDLEFLDELCVEDLERLIEQDLGTI